MLIVFASLNAIDGICCPDGCTHEEASTSQHDDRESSDGSCVLCLGGVESAASQAWTTSLESVRGALDADAAHDRLVLLRATSQELGPTRDAVVDTAVQRLELSQKQAAEAYTLAETFETNPRSVWGYVQGLTRLSQRTPWQDGRFTLDRAASRLLTTVH
jgi:hypothetical protein